MALHIDMSGMERQIRDEAARVLHAAGDIVLADVKDACPVGQDTPTRRTAPGGLRDSFAITQVDDIGDVYSLTIGTDVEYASFTDEEDTAPHLIFASASKVLRFWWDNGPGGPGIYNLRFVRHPGTHGQHWFASQNQTRWQSALQQAAA